MTNVVIHNPRWLVLLIAITAATGQGRVSKTGQPAYQIAFEGSCEGQVGICRMNSDGSDPRFVHSGSVGFLQGNWWSPDGRKILYIDQGRAVHVTDIDGTGDAELPGPIEFPLCLVWSPDSTRLAFVSALENSRQAEDPRPNRPPSSAIFVVNVQTKELNRVSSFGGTGGVSWAPDGHRIVFSGVEPGATQAGIYVVDTKERVPGLVFSAPEAWYSLQQPAWSPQGD
jgi:Tol biopolymer transport system component